MTPDELLEIAKALKPCPWCGHKPKIVALGEWYKIECHNDECPMATVRTYSYRRSLLAKAAAAWNGQEAPTDGSKP